MFRLISQQTIYAGYDIVNFANAYLDVLLFARPNSLSDPMGITTIFLDNDALPDIRIAYALDNKKRVVCYDGESYSINVIDTTKGLSTALELPSSHYFTTDISTSPHGIAVTSETSFAFFDDSDHLVWHSNTDESNMDSLPFPQGEMPFWRLGARSISCGLNSFFIAGGPLPRIDEYSYQGEFIKSIKGFYTDELSLNFSVLPIMQVRSDIAGNTWIVCDSRILAFSSNGDPWIASSRNLFKGIVGPSPKLGIDRQGLVWLSGIAQDGVRRIASFRWNG